MSRRHSLLVVAPLSISQSAPAAAGGRPSLAARPAFFSLPFHAEIVPYYLGDPCWTRGAHAWSSSGAATNGFSGDRAAAASGSAGHIVRLIHGTAVSIRSPGAVFFPRGTHEKSTSDRPLLRDDLKRRGIGVRMTLTTDTLIAPATVRHCNRGVRLSWPAINSLARCKGYTTSALRTSFPEAKTMTPPGSPRWRTTRALRARP